MVGVAGGIGTVLQVDFTRSRALGELTVQEAVFLLGVNIADEALLCLEVEGDGIVLVGVLSHLEHRRACQLVVGIGDFLGSLFLGFLLQCHRTSGMHLTRVQTHIDLLTLQVHVLVFHVRRAIEIGHVGAGKIDDRVLGGVFHWRVDAVLALAVHRVEADGVVDGFVVPVDGQLQRVHLRCVHLQSLGGELLCVSRVLRLTGRVGGLLRWCLFHLLLLVGGVGRLLFVGRKTCCQLLLRLFPSGHSDIGRRHVSLGVVALHDVSQFGSHVGERLLQPVPTAA